MSNRLSRRQFFRLAPSDFLQGIVEKRQGEAREEPPIRPPGALPEAQFLDVCERCTKCSQACPYEVIRHLGAAAGAAEGTPFLVPQESPCHWCETMDCAHACPSGALRLVEGKMPGPIAKAEIELGACLVSDGILCDTCVHYCPTSIGAIKMVGRSPVLDADACVGCGLCARQCSASTSAIRITPVSRDA